MTTNTIADVGLAALAVGTIVKALPPFAACLAIIWYLIQIWQSETGKMWRARWRRLFVERTLTVEDKMVFLVLGLGGTGCFLALLALGVIMP